MNKIFFILVLSANFLTAQTTHYYATGKDSVTYLATNFGLVVLSRNNNQEFVFHSILDDSNKVYTRGLDTEHFLLFSTDSQIDMYSLANKYSPAFIGTLYLDKIISIRPFGNHFAILRTSNQFSGFADHYIVGIENDSLKILATLNSYQLHYTGRTMFTPEVVYPYFFSTPNSSNKLMVHKFNEANKSFIFLDSLSTIDTTFSFVQMYGGKDRLFVKEYKTGSGPYAKKYKIGNDSLFLISIDLTSGGPFMDEIECTDTLIRFNAWYTYLNGIQLSEPNQYLYCCANLSGLRIYNTAYSNRLSYSTKIVGTTINSAQYVYTPSSIDDAVQSTNFFLSQNYPNPFNPSTRIQYQLSNNSQVTLKVYDVLGNEVATLVDEYKPTGSYEVEFQSAIDNKQLASGIYFYQLRAVDPESSSGQGFVETKKMILLR